MITEIIKLLLDSGLTQTEISRRSNVPQSRIQILQTASNQPFHTMQASALNSWPLN
jgi:predicted transcriptional regulator